MKLYKPTDIKDRTNEKTGWESTTKWGKRITRKAKGGQLIRAHLHPLLAFLSQLAAETEVFTGVHLWEAEGEPVSDDTLEEKERLTANDKTFGVVKCGEITTIRQMEVPSISSETLVAAGILCTLEVFDEPQFVEWANSWLNGKDRTKASTKAVFDKASAVSSSALNKAKDAAKDRDADSHLRNMVLFTAAQAAYQATFAATMLATKDESAGLPQAADVYRAAIASSMSGTRAVDSVFWANNALSQLRKEHINLLRILEGLGN